MYQQRTDNERGGMLRRDFSQQSQNHVPVGGYEQFRNPQMQEVGGYRPPQTFSARQLRRAGLLVLEPEVGAEVAPDMTEFEIEFSLGNEVLTSMDLPISAVCDEVKQSIHDNEVTILVSPTGSGKTTETPKMILEMGRNSVTTQPRRLPANLNAAYIQAQLDEKIGSERAKGMVGVLTAEHSTLTEKTNTKMITDGIAARPKALARLMDDKTVLILDEIHERNKNMDEALGYDTIRHRNDPSARTVVMSATVNAQAYVDFYKKHTGKQPHVIEIDGRAKEIEDRVEAESTVIDQALQCVAEGDRVIAVILPGKQQIADTISAIRKRLPTDSQEQILVVPLHARQTRMEQDMAVTPCEGVKIICATNVMESSVTIPGLSAVVDAGLVRRVYLDENGNEALRIVDASKAEMMQRRGRTGRDVDGKYIQTRLNEDVAFVPMEDRQEYSEPEMMRTNIDQVVLQLAAEGHDIDTFPLPDMPNERTRRNSKRLLRDIGALDENGHITELGLRMERFPVHPVSARMLMEALPFNSHLRSQLSAIVAIMEAGDLVDYSNKLHTGWKDVTSQRDSDLFAQLELFVKSQDKTNRQLRSLGMDVKNVRRAQEIHRKLVRQTDSWDGEIGPLREEHKEQLTQAIAAGLITHLYKHVGEGMYERMGGRADNTPRELSNRSVIKDFPEYVFAKPYTIEFWHEGDLVSKPILESATILKDMRILGRVAANHLLSWREEGRSFRHQGQLKIVERRVFNGSISLSEARERDAIATPSNRSYMSNHLLENAGPAQQNLRAIKREIEVLQRLTPEKLPVITQAELLGLLKEAMADGVMEESYIDNRLRQIMQERNITLDSRVSPEKRQEIRAKSPEAIMIQGHKLALNYHFAGGKSGVPVITNVSSRFLEVCSPDLRLPDGREIFIWYERRRISLREMLAKHAEMLAEL